MGGIQSLIQLQTDFEYVSRELASELLSQEITVNALHPGMIITNIWNLWPKNKILTFLIGLIEKTGILSAEKGAKTSVYLATSPDVEKSTDGFYKKCRHYKWPVNCRDIEMNRTILQLFHQYQIV